VTKLIGIIAAALALAVFSIENMQPVNINLLFINTVTPLIFLLTASYMAGAITVYILSTLRRYLKEKDRKNEKKRIISKRRKIYS